MSKPGKRNKRKKMTGRQSYNLVTDTVAGPNLRLKDNLIQGIAILVCVLLGAGIGWLAADTPFLGVFLGGFAGLVVGFFGSGIFLMVYRAVRHIRQEHD